MIPFSNTFERSDELVKYGELTLRNILKQNKIVDYIGLIYNNLGHFFFLKIFKRTYNPTHKQFFEKES